MRPNVLIIYTDQQRYDSLGCYGNDKAITPHLDSLANNGLQLNNYFVQNPVCMASRMSFLTGRYPGNLGIGCNGTPLNENTMTVHKILKPYGYHTGNIGKLHFQPHAKRDYRNPHPMYGFDTLILSDEPGCYDDAYSKWVEMKGGKVKETRTSLPPAAEYFGKPSYSDVPRNTHEPYIFEAEEEYTHSRFVVEETNNYINQHKDEPFFCIAGLYAPHTPVNPPKRFLDLYEDVIFEPPILGDQEKMSEELRGITPEKWQDIIRHYMALVSHVDDCVGRIINHLEEQKLLDKTLIIFTSDHGEYLGDHGRIQKGMPGHDCIIKVPCLVHLPKSFYQLDGMDSVIKPVVEAVDIVPTILDVCGVMTPDFVQGKSLLPLLTGKTKKHKQSALVEYFEPVFYNLDKSVRRSSTIRTEEYMYNVTEEEEILYDLVSDPKQINNVVKDEKYHDILLSLRLELIRRIQATSYIRRDRPEEY